MRIVLIMACRRLPVCVPWSACVRAVLLAVASRIPHVCGLGLRRLLADSEPLLGIVSYRMRAMRRVLLMASRDAFAPSAMLHTYLTISLPVGRQHCSPSCLMPSCLPCRAFRLALRALCVRLCLLDACHENPDGDIQTYGGKHSSMCSCRCLLSLGIGGGRDAIVMSACKLSGN